VSRGGPMTQEHKATMTFEPAVRQNRFTLNSPS
jgi:hypothetical protein